MSRLGEIRKRLEARTPGRWVLGDAPDPWLRDKLDAALDDDADQGGA